MSVQDWSGGMRIVCTECDCEVGINGCCEDDGFYDELNDDCSLGINSGAEGDWNDGWGE